MDDTANGRVKDEFSKPNLTNQDIIEEKRKAKKVSNSVQFLTFKSFQFNQKFDEYIEKMNRGFKNV